MSPLDFSRTVLRRPEDLVPEDPDSAHLSALLPPLLIIVVVCGAFLGALLGRYRGDSQILYGAAKMPLVLLVPTLIGAPALYAFTRLSDPGCTWTRAGLATLAGTARSALLMVAMAPVLWLLLAQPTLRHQGAVLSVAGLFVLAGAPGLATAATLCHRASKAPASLTLTSAIILGLLVAQSSWLLRPFLGHRDDPVAAFAPPERHVIQGLTDPRGHP